MSGLPLAEILRPHSLSDFVGQPNIAGENGLVNRLLQQARQSDYFPSLILWGPPGCGKTTLARLIAKELKRPFFEFSTVVASVKDIEKAIPPHSTQQLQLSAQTAPVIFIDEIHRFNKAQQDVLLPYIERGDILFLGATTENPSFSIISALLSRCRTLTLSALDEDSLQKVIIRALAYTQCSLTPEAESFLLQAANGDARVILNVLEIASHLVENSVISVDDLENALQKRQLNFDNKGEEFYNTISALHKSVRGSDPDASLYWLARMLEAGQDPLYVARRLIRMASEDIGLAQPNALLITNAAYDACAHLGMPECVLALAQATAYLAKAPKSNALYTAYSEASSDVRQFGNLPVPMHIRNAPTKFMKTEGYGKDYNYYHSPTGQKLPDQEYLPEKLAGKCYLSEK